MSRGLRNNNPGNIRLSQTKYKGEVESTDKAFKQFCGVKWGYRAMFVLLHTYQKRHNLNTIRQMILRYAPPTENFTAGYVKYVAEQSGLGADQTVDALCAAHMLPIVAAMSQIENGKSAVMSDIEQGWELFESHMP